MSMEPEVAVAQAGLPEVVPDLIGLAGTFVLVIMLAAMAGIAYKHFTGGIEWPDEAPEDDDEGLRRGGDEEEWEYY